MNRIARCSIMLISSLLLYGAVSLLVTGSVVTSLDVNHPIKTFDATDSFLIIVVSLVLGVAGLLCSMKPETETDSETRG